MGKAWTREEEILALLLYCEIPFGKISASNSTIRQLAIQLGRTPASVSMKMGNFARFDPVLRQRGVKGLSNGSKLDAAIWNEFSVNWSALVREGQEIKSRFGIVDQTETDDEEQSVLENLPTGETRTRSVETRVHQTFFRKMVLSSYDFHCCITGLQFPSLLVASHIKPWRDSDPIRERINPTNGLCLNALHDKAFDMGYITVTPDYRLHVSNKIREQYTSEVVKIYFQTYEGKQINLPHRFIPQKEFLEYHNDVIFGKK